MSQNLHQQREAGFWEGGRWRQFYGPAAVTDVTRRSSERILRERSSHVVASLDTMLRLVLWETGGVPSMRESKIIPFALRSKGSLLRD